MSKDQVDAKIARMIEEARPALRPGWEERAVEAMRKARPAGRGKARLAIAVAAGVVLIGLGSLLFPAGGARGAWDRAVAAAEKAPAMHITGRVVGAAGAFEFEQWASADGFQRYDLRREGRTVRMWLWDPLRAHIAPDGLRDSIAGRVTDPPLAGTHVSLLGPNAPDPFIRPESLRMNVVPIGGPKGVFGVGPKERLPTEEVMLKRLNALGQLFHVEAAERRRASSAQGGREIVEVEGRARSDEGEQRTQNEVTPLSYPYGPRYLEGERIRVRAEMDPASDRLSSLAIYKLREDVWEPVYETESVEWEVEIPESVRTPPPPDEHIAHMDTWWAPRLGNAIATGGSQDWEVTLNAVDVNQYGDLFLTLTRRAKGGDRRLALFEGIASFAMSLEAVDDLGVRYSAVGQRQNRAHGLKVVAGHKELALVGPADCHARVRMSRDSRHRFSGGRSPRTLTVTLHLGAGPGELQTISLRNVPLPARPSVRLPSRSTGDDLMEEAYEKWFY